MVRLTIDRYLDQHGITRYELAKRTEVKFQTIDRYYKNRVVRYDSYILDRICEALECSLGDRIREGRRRRRAVSLPSQVPFQATAP